MYRKNFLFIIFVFLFLFSLSFNLTNANTSDFYKIHVNVWDSNTRNIILKSRKAVNYTEKQQILKQGIKSIDRTFITKDKAVKISCYCIELAENAKKNGDYDDALKWYWAGAHIFKEAYTYNNNPLVLGCLFNGLEIINSSEQTDNVKDLKTKFLLEIEQTQLGLVDKYPYIYKSIFDSLALYYKNKKNAKKYFYYERKASEIYAEYLKKYPLKLEIEDYAVYISDPKVANYIELALKSKQYIEKQKNLMLAVNSIDKNNMSNKDALTVAMINCYIGQNAKNNMDMKIAASAFMRSYKFLKSKNIHKNNRIALYCLGNIYYLSKLSENEHVSISVLVELVETQNKFKNIYKEQFLEHYKDLAKYYKNDSYKYQYYTMKAKALEK